MEEKEAYPSPPFNVLFEDYMFQFTNPSNKKTNDKYNAPIHQRQSFNVKEAVKHRYLYNSNLSKRNGCCDYEKSITPP